MQEEVKETTLNKFFKTVWHQKWITLIVFVVITILSAVIIQYGYNPSRESYTIEFSLNLPGDNGSVVYNYPDGKQFYYSDMTSLSTLKHLRDVKNDPAFKDVDVEAMANNGHINIQRDIAVMTDSATGTTPIYREISYTIKVKSSYFESEGKARAFLEKLADTPKNYLLEMKIKYDGYLDMAKQAEDYEDEIDYLQAQLDDIQSKYATLIKTYGDSFVADEKAGKTLLAYSQEVNAYNSSSVLNDLLTEARTNFYVKKDSTVDYSLKKKELENELAKAQETLDKLELIYKGNEGSSTVVLDASVLKAQYDLVYDLNYQISILDGYSNGTYSKEFDNSIQEAIKKVEGFTNDYSTASATVYERASSVVYLNPGIVALQGGFSLIKTVIFSVVVGIVIALIAGYVAGYLTLKKEKQKAEASANTAVPESADEENK